MSLLSQGRSGEVKDAVEDQCLPSMRWTCRLYGRRYYQARDTAGREHSRPSHAIPLIGIRPPLTRQRPTQRPALSKTSCSSWRAIRPAILSVPRGRRRPIKLGAERLDVPMVVMHVEIWHEPAEG